MSAQKIGWRKTILMSEGNSVLSLIRHDLFQDGGDTLKNIINKYVITPRSKNICLARNTLKFFVDKRLCEPPYSDNHLNVKAPIHNNEAKTFAFLYEVAQPTNDKQTIIKVDMNILQRLITACREGREVNLENFPQLELMAVPSRTGSTVFGNN